MPTSTPYIERAVFGGGCFWCVEAIFSRLRGVESVVSGYAGGLTVDPTYGEVSSGKTGHAEVTEIHFDPTVIPYEILLKVFFAMHDPTTPNRQGADIGTQYRSIIFTITEAQRETAERVLTSIESEHIFDRPIVTEIRPLDVFYQAEVSHQEYYQRHPEQAYCQVVIAPKLTRLRASFQELLK